MSKVKSIRQALAKMAKDYPEAYVTAKTELIRYSNGKTEAQRQVYSSLPKQPQGYGVSGRAKTWDEAFRKIEEETRKVQHEQPSVD